MASQTAIRERVTTEIIEALKKGVVPWRKPWSAAGNTGFPRNIVSQRHYGGVNRLLLTCAAIKKGFQSQWWGTYHQWRKRGCRVRQRPQDVEPGRWGSRVIFYQSLTTTIKNKKGDEEERTFPFLKEYHVWNAEQVDGAEGFHAQAEETQTAPDFEPAEQTTGSRRSARTTAPSSGFHRQPMSPLTSS